MRTWTVSRKSNDGTRRERLWLRDDLPSAMPDARIFILTYDSRVLFTTNELLTHEADNLLARLEMERAEVWVPNSHLTAISDLQQCKQRPIIFVAHSLGGILVKQVRFHAGHCQLN